MRTRMSCFCLVGAPERARLQDRVHGSSATLEGRGFWERERLLFGKVECMSTVSGSGVGGAERDSG